MTILMQSWRYALSVALAVATVGVPCFAEEEAPARVAEPAETKPVDEDSELIQQRRPDGSVQVERYVAQDDEGNYVNHGTWKQYNEEGKIIAEGRFIKNQRHGTWQRHFEAANVKLCNEAPYKSFTGPFISEATLNHGKLHGSWVIYDHEKNKVSEIEFADGKRHGKATWFYPNGKPMQISTFVDGVINGELIRYEEDGSVKAKEEYQDGRKVETQVDYYANKQKRSETKYLHPKLVIAMQDDFWNVTLAAFAARGEARQHGVWTAWHQNGQKMEEGTFDFGRRVGKFYSWHANGQKASEGDYHEGKQHGAWTWWHANGQKQTSGNYTHGRRSGDWAWWNEEGRIEEKTSLVTPKQRTIEDTADDSERTARRIEE